MTDRPDVLLMLAWEAGLDRKALIREGADAAHFLLAGERNESVKLFWPVPRPLEAVDRWSATPRNDTTPPLRPYASTVIPVTVLGTVVAWRAPDIGSVTLMGIMIAATAVLGGLFKLLDELTLRRRVARLDEDAAWSIVLDQLRAGMDACPTRIPRAVEWIRDGLRRITASSGVAPAPPRP